MPQREMDVEKIIERYNNRLVIQKRYLHKKVKCVLCNTVMLIHSKVYHKNTKTHLENLHKKGNDFHEEIFIRVKDETPAPNCRKQIDPKLKNIKCNICNCIVGARCRFMHEKTKTHIMNLKDTTIDRNEIFTHVKETPQRKIDDEKGDKYVYCECCQVFILNTSKTQHKKSNTHKKNNINNLEDTFKKYG